MNLTLSIGEAAGRKTAVARSLFRCSMSGRTGVLSTQVLQEFYVNARKKLQPMERPLAPASRCTAPLTW